MERRDWQIGAVGKISKKRFDNRNHRGYEKP